MSNMLKHSIAATAFVVGLLSLTPVNSAFAYCVEPQRCEMPSFQPSEMSPGPQNFEGRHKRDRNFMMFGNEPSYGILEGGARLMIVIQPRREGPPVVHGKNNCDHLKRQIAAGERRLAQMNSRLDQMLADYQDKKVSSTSADVYYTGDSIVKLDDNIKDLERALNTLRKKLAKCESARWF